ncbi:hypothetical protein CA11_25840 [Gimesia maris]|uniref:hypothetical protein n=1 Tax=Gimesia maris TaxID=122 RepID=UPI00118BA7A7|nr:hypothetical protein [Gimesia maris]QDU14774.1 hypothetical protein CA11_25840 [Gimesia maris]
MKSLFWKRYSVLFMISLLISGCTAADAGPEETETETKKKPDVAESRKKKPTVCRLFIQDHAGKTVYWADIRKGETLEMSTPSVVPGFPKLDAKQQNLVQMESSQQTMLVGVRDHKDGTNQSGWVFLETGVEEESHGDHAHWKFKQEPHVIQSQLDDQQGNPAHLYCYQGVYYLANDQNSGYTRIDPRSYRDYPESPITAGFHRGGGQHITLAVVDGTTGYASWIAGGGPKKGLVDVTRILPEGNSEICYSFTLPTGAIHGLTTCGGKVFFAPADGICWCVADRNPLPSEQQQVNVQYISLGVDSETQKPQRTGAFTTHRNYVLFVTGKGPDACVCLLNAESDHPELISVPVPMLEGNSPVSLEVCRTAWGKRLAFVFHNHRQELEQDEFFSVIELDPDGDLDFQDASLLKTMKVGDSKVEGHYGHHTIAFDQAGRYGFWSEPGTGLLKALSLETLMPVGEFSMPGVPTKVNAVGQQDQTD